MTDPSVAGTAIEAGLLGRAREPRAIPGGWLWAIAAVVVVALSIALVLPDGPIVNAGGWSLLRRFAAAALRPELGGGLAALALSSALTTLAYAVAGTVLAVAGGLVLGVLSSEMWWRGRRWGAGPFLTLRAALAVPRGIHEGIWGLLLINVLGLDPLVAVLAIAIPYGAITAKVFSEILDETPREAQDALEAMGAGRLAAVAYATIPRAGATLVSYALYRFECAVRAAALLGLIGAGGLGYQILLSLQSLRLEQVWTFLYALIALVAVIDLMSVWVTRALDVTARVRAAGIGAAEEGMAARRVARGQRWGRIAWAGGTVAVAAAFVWVGADFGMLRDARTGELLAGVVRQSLPLDVSRTTLLTLGSLSIDTLAMAVVAIALAAGGGLLLALPSSASIALPPGEPRGVIATAARGLALLSGRFVLLVARALAEPIWALLVLFILFPGALAGAIGLGLYNLGVLGRLFAEAVETIDQRPAAALRAQGAGTAAVVAYAVLPAMMGRVVALSLYRFEVCVRATAIVGVVGAGGLGRRLAEELARFDYPAAATTLAAYVVLTLFVDLTGAGVRRALR